MTLEIENIQNPVTINNKVYLLVEQTQIEKLLDDNLKQKAIIEDYKQDIGKLQIVIKGILKVLGLLDESTGTLKESIANGEESYTKPIIKSLGKLALQLATSKEQLAKDFSFIELIFPIMKKHTGN